KLGEVVKSIMLREKYDVPIRRSAPIVVAERLTDGAGLVLLGCFGLSGLAYGSFLIVPLIAALVAIGVVFGSERLGTSIIQRVGRIKRLARIQRLLEDLHASLRLLMTPRAYAVGTLLSTLSWAMHGFVVWVLAGIYENMTLGIADAMLAYSM